MSTIQPIQLRAKDGGARVDTDQGCSACKGECPCPQACERREEARALERRRPFVGLVALVCRRLA